MASNFERTVYIVELRDKFSMGMNRATAVTNRFNRSMVTARTNTTLLGSALRGLAVGAAAGAAYGIARVTTQIIKMAAELETTTIAFEVMLKSATKAQSLVGYGKEFARVTPFTQRQVFGNMRQLLAYGAPEENVRGYNKMLSTIAAGVGMERLPFLTLALGQVIAKGRLQGQELRQFTEHGVPVVGGLAKRMGISTQDVYDRMRKGQISSQDVVDTMMDMVRTGGLFEGMLERLKESFSGTMARMKSSWQLALIDGINPLIDNMKVWMNTAIKWADLVYILKDSFTILASSMTEMFRPLMELLGSIRVLSGMGAMDIVANVFKVLITGLSTLATVTQSVWTLVVTPLKSVLTVVADLWSGIKMLMDNPAQGVFQIKSAFNNAFKDTNPHTGVFDELTKIWKDYVFNTVPGIWRKKKAPGAVDMGDPYGQMIELWRSAFGDSEDGGAGAAGKKSVARRLVGTGARDIVIHIGNLIENMQISSPSIGESADQLTERVKMALLTAVNDASILADR